MKQRNVLQNKQGIAIMSVLLMFTVMTIFVGGITMVSVSNVNQSDVNVQSLSAYYAAEGGLNRILEEYRSLYENSSLTAAQVQNEIGSIRSKYHMQSMELKDNNGKPVNVEFWYDVHDHDLINRRLMATIVSEGQVGDVVRTLETVVEFTYGTGTTTMNMQLRHAVFVRNSITTANNATITTVNPSNTNIVPRIATLSSHRNSITLNGVKFARGEIELTSPSPNCVNTVVEENSRKDGTRCRINDTILVTEDRPVEAPEIRINFPEINFTPIRDQVAGIMASSSNYTNLGKNNINGLMMSNKIKEGNFFIEELDFSRLAYLNTLKVEKDVFIITNELTLGDVLIEGEGKLTIFVNEGSKIFTPLSKSHEVFGRESEQEKLVVYVDTISGINNNRYHVIFANNTHTKGYFIFENARVEFGNNSTFNGALYTAAVNGSLYAVRLSNNAYIDSSGGRALIVATNGSVHMNNNSSLTGAIIATNVTLAGGKTTITFDPDFPQNIPFEITSPIEVANPGGLSKRLTIRNIRER